MSKKLRVPKRVLMTADTVGGVWTYALELTRTLTAEGVQVGLATMGARLNRDQLAELEMLPHVQVFQSNFKLEWMDEPRADVERAGHWLLELEKSFQPDVIHLNSYSHGAFPWRSPKVVVGHSCVLSWWRAVNGCDAPREWDEYRDAVMAGLHGAELVVAPSRAMLEALNEHYGPFKNSVVIPNGRRLPVLKQSAKHEFIFAAGRLWDEAKNISSLAKIAPQLSWPIYIAGEENDPQGRRTNYQHVHYAGRLSAEEMLSYLERATIYALPARYEPFGLSALEAALAGCALVLGDIPSLREIWGDAALFVNPEDPAALLRALQDLIASPAEIARLAAKARCAAQQYTPERIADAYLLAYGSILPASPELSEKSAYANRTLLSNLVV